MPVQFKLEGGAVTPDDAISPGFDRDWFVSVADQAVTGQGRIVILSSGVVETPIFGHAVLGVNGAFADVIPQAGGF